MLFVPSSVTKQAKNSVFKLFFICRLKCIYEKCKFLLNNRFDLCNISLTENCIFELKYEIFRFSMVFGCHL